MGAQAKALALLLIMLAAIPALAAVRPAEAQGAPPAQMLLPGAPPGQPMVGELPGFRYAGPLPSDAPVVGAVYVPLRNLGLLYYYAVEANTPGSPLYHHYLTRQEVQKLFYPTGQFDRVLHYLESRGLRVLFTAADSIIVFEGEARQVEEALNVTIGLFTNGTASYYASVGQPWALGALVYVSNVTAFIMRSPQFLLTLRSLRSWLAALGVLQNVSLPEEAYTIAQVVGAYNATPLYDQGYYGQNVSVGVLDFYGNPTIYQDLAYYDRLFDLPPANLTVVPIGPYNPNLGVYTGWSYEIDLDVEAVHTVAPRARIVLYVANGAVPLAAAVAYIDQQDAVSIVTQSFGVPESYFSNLGYEFYLFNVYLTDIYYALGAAEGITFLAASGDGGGMGYSAGPVGAVAYPASSPWVLAVGGTTTYIDFGAGNSTLSYYQAAWSSMGFVPYFVNIGGSTGGYSAYEPMPWWQYGVVPRPPQGFPLGRAVPDVAANAGLFPGVYVVITGNETVVTGGTSEASPIVAGLLALVESRLGHRLGLIAPTLYWLYSYGYSAAFEPVTFGYDIPWTAGPGYNLVTGLGAINAGVLADYLEALPPKGGLDIEVFANVSSTVQNYTVYEAYPGEVVNVSARVVAPNGTPVSSGSFRLRIATPSGIALTAPLSYNSTTGLWTAVVEWPNTSGDTLVEVEGASGWLAGAGALEVFSGYFASFDYPEADEPWSMELGVPVQFMVTSLNGTPAPGQLAYDVVVMEYKPLSNNYERVYEASLQGAGAISELTGNVTPGMLYIATEGPVIGLVPFLDGPNLETLYILPPVVSSPGAVAPGQALLIYGLPQPPLESYYLTSVSLGTPLSTAIEYGSNVTALLVSPQGTVVSEAAAALTPGGYYEGLLCVPENASPGLYFVLLESNYSSTYSGWIGGAAMGMVYVEPAAEARVWASPEYPAQGQEVRVYANVTWGGAPLTYGVLSATLYPSSAPYLFEYAMEYVQVPLYYNATLGLWVGSLELPSPFSSGVAAAYAGLYAGEPWTVVVSGVGANGGNVVASAQVLETRLVYVSDRNLTYGEFYPYLDEFRDVNITYNGTISDSVFLGVDRVVDSDLTIKDSTVHGILVLVNSNVTLVSTVARAVVAYGSNVTLMSSSVEVLGLLNGSRLLYVGPTSYVYAGNQTGLVEQIEALWAAVRRLAGYLKGNVTSLRAEVAEVNETLGEEVARLYQEVSAYASELSVSKRLPFNETQVYLGVGYVETQILSLSSQMAQLKSYLEGNLTEISATLDAIKANVSGLAQQVSQLEAEASGLGVRLSAVESQVSEVYAASREAGSSALMAIVMSFLTAALAVVIFTYARRLLTRYA